MVGVLKDIKWLINYMISIVMYAIIVILLLIGLVLLVYFIDFKIRDSRIETPLYGAYVIISGSMEPIIKVKDAVIIRRVEEEDIKEGDVVTYYSLDPTYYGILITHRVVSISEENGEKVYVTKGDNNATVDRSPITFNQIRGKVVMRIPKIGYLKYFLVSSYGWILAVVVPSLGVISYDIVKLIKKIKNKDQEEEKVLDPPVKRKKVISFEE